MKQVICYGSLILWAVASLWGDEHITRQSAQLVVQRYAATTPRFFSISTDGESAIMIRGDDYGHRFGFELLRAKDGKLLQSGSMPDFNFLGHGYGVSPSLNKLIYCGRGVPAQILDLRNENRAITLKAKDPEFCKGAIVNDDGQAILLYQEKIEVYAFSQDGKAEIIRTIPPIGDIVNGKTAVSPDGKLIAVAGDGGKITVLKLNSMEKVFSKSSSFLFMGTHSAALDYLQFSRDGRFLVSSDGDGNLYVHTIDGSKVAGAKVNSKVLYLNLSEIGSPDGCLTRTVMAGQKQKHIFCTPEGMSINLAASEGKVSRVSIGTLEKQFALAAYLRPQFVSNINHTSMELTADSGKPARTISLENIGLESGKTIVAKSNDGIHFALWHSTQPDEGWISASKFYAIKVEGNKAVLLASERVSIITGGFTAMKPGTVGYSTAGAIQQFSQTNSPGLGIQRSAGDNQTYTMLDFDPVSETLIGINGNRIVLWDNSGKVIAEGGDAARITELRMSRSGEMFLTAAEDNTITIWKTANLTRLLTFLQTEDGWVAAAGDGRYEYAGGARELLHYSAGGEVIALGDFDGSFLRRNLVAEILSGKATPVVLPSENKSNGTQEITKKLKGKIHSMTGPEINLGGTGFAMGERVFVIVGGKPVYLKVVFPTHTGAKAKVEKTNDLKVLRAGMPVFR